MSYKMTQLKSIKPKCLNIPRMINSNTLTKIRSERKPFDEYALTLYGRAYATFISIFYYIKIPFWSLQSNLRVAINSDALLRYNRTKTHLAKRHWLWKHFAEMFADNYYIQSYPCPTVPIICKKENCALWQKCIL